MSNRFTIRYQRIERTLLSSAQVGEAFDPNYAKPPLFPCKAVWDTGATLSSITGDLAQRIGLLPIGKIGVTGVHGQKQVNKYLISLFLPNNIYFAAFEAAELNFVGGDILIGMDIITQGDLAISNFEHKTTLSFRVPSQETIDFK